MDNFKFVAMYEHGESRNISMEELFRVVRNSDPAINRLMFVPMSDSAEIVPVALPPQSAKVSRISYGRTYNTGFYTNTRLDVTVEVPPNEKAADVLKQLEQVFTEADPNNAKEDFKTNEAKAVLSMPASLITQDDLGKLSIARQTVAAFEERKKRMATARNLLDHLGAQAVFKDGRWTWDDSDNQEIPFPKPEHN